MPVIEVGLIVMTGATILHILARKGKLSNSNSNSAFTLVLIAAIGIHFGNYFHSALAKILLDGGPLSWVTTNNTHYLIATSLEHGLLPIAPWPSLVQLGHDLFEQNKVLLNSITLIGQLACIYFISSPRKVILTTLFYDLTHICIYLVSGIFFWKWIILNLLIVAAMQKTKGKKFTTEQKMTGVLATLFGILFFFTAQLAWYDTKSLRHIYIEAIDDQGVVYQAPTNYFLNTSITLTQGRIIKKPSGHFTGIDSLGSTSKINVKNLAENRSLNITPKQAMEHAFGRLKPFIIKHHNYIMMNLDNDGSFNYDHFPHHVWSNPSIHKEFKALDKRRIEAYQIVIESKYLSLDNGKINKRQISTTKSQPIKVQSYSQITSRNT